VAPTWQPGQILAGRYRLDAHLGSGAAAQVWRALDTKLRALVAIKLLDPTFAETDVAARFLREARSAAQLRSLHVVQILDHGMHDEAAPYIVMELLEGETLAQRLDKVRCLAAADVCRVLGHVAKAVSKAHALNIVHRDLKPQNVFLVRDADEEEIAKVFDFGIVKITLPPAERSTSTTLVGSLLGTPEYMSPEQASGDSVDWRTDLYAMGIVAAECVTGQVPFRTEDPGEVIYLAARGDLLRPSEIAEVPPRFDAWFAQSTARDPAQRFASAKDQIDALREVLLGR
jgi:eukaryotic-like serine/threonine-protein kinase